MNDLFLFWLSLSLSGSLVALMLILLRPLLRQFSKTWQYYLWLLVVLRLLIPFSPTVSIVGGLFQQVEMRLTVQSEPVEQVSKFHSPEGTQFPVAPDIEMSNPPKPSVAIDALAVLKNYILGALWLSIAMLLFVRKVVGYGRFLKTVKRESKIILNEQLSVALQVVSTAMGIQKRISVCSNSLVRAPMLIGFIKPIIVLPNEDISSSELTFILRHELTHYRRMDFLYKWLAEIVVCLHWFNPLVYWVRKQINQDCEFSCDETVVACLVVSERQTYGETLLNSIVLNNFGGSDIVSLSLNKDGKLIKERLIAIMKYHPKPKWFAFVASLLTSVLLCGSVFAGAYTMAATENVNTNQPPQSKSDLGQLQTITARTVVYENVEMHHNVGKEEFDYISNVRTNNTTQKIVSCDRAMLAYDKDGNPLKLDWWARDSEINYHFLGRHGGLTREVLPGQKDQQTKGWRLNAMSDPQVEKVAYVLFCDVSITFEDGNVWTNSEYETWRSTYEGKKVDAKVLENYYPFEQEITIPVKAIDLAS